MEEEEPRAVYGEVVSATRMDDDFMKNMEVGYQKMVEEKLSNQRGSSKNHAGHLGRIIAASLDMRLKYLHGVLAMVEKCCDNGHQQVFTKSTYQQIVKSLWSTKKDPNADCYYRMLRHIQSAFPSHRHEDSWRPEYIVVHDPRLTFIDLLNSVRSSHARALLLEYMTSIFQAQADQLVSEQRYDENNRNTTILKRLIDTNEDIIDVAIAVTINSYKGNTRI